MVPLYEVILLVSLVLLANQYLVARSVDSEEKVTYLPGYEGPLPFEFYTGYITVNETTQDNMFYYFVKSERNPVEDPLILWMTGGPGCTGFSGLVFEIGPLRFKVEKYNGSLPTLFSNPYSFTKNASIIFVDSPVGTGFSYSLTAEGYQTGDYRTTDEAYVFLTKWLLTHHEFSSNPLYIGGDSYGGTMVPLLTARIVKEIEEGSKVFASLKGYFVGNPVTDKWTNATRIAFARDMGLIPEDLYEATKKSCDGQYYIPGNEECAKYIQIIEALYADINEAQVFEFSCTGWWSPQPKQSMRSRWRTLKEHQSYQQINPIPPLQCRIYGYFLCDIWANDDSVRKALHVREGTIAEWQRCNKTLGDDFNRQVETVVEYHRSLTTKGYRLLVYSGDVDLGVPHTGTEGWISALNYTILEQWHPWYVGSQVAGYTRKYANNLTYATVKGAGHTAPEYKPKECYNMIQRWLTNQSL